MNSFSSVFLKVSFIPIKYSPVKRFEKRQWRQVKLFSKMLPIITAASGDVIRREKSFQTLFWLPRLLLTFSDQFSEIFFLFETKQDLGERKLVVSSFCCSINLSQSPIWWMENSLLSLADQTNFLDEVVLWMFNYRVILTSIWLLHCW